MQKRRLKWWFNGFVYQDFRKHIIKNIQHVTNTDCTNNLYTRKLKVSFVYLVGTWHLYPTYILQGALVNDQNLCFPLNLALICAPIYMFKNHMGISTIIMTCRAAFSHYCIEVLDLACKKRQEASVTVSF